MLRQVETTLLSPAFFVSNHLSINFLEVLFQYHFRKKVYLKANMQTCLLPNINENKSFVLKINTSHQDNSLITLRIIFFQLITIAQKYLPHIAVTRYVTPHLHVVVVKEEVLIKYSDCPPKNEDFITFLIKSSSIRKKKYEKQSFL